MESPFDNPQKRRRGRLVKRDDRDDNPIASYVRRARVGNGWSQADMAQYAGVALSTVRALEQGKISMNLGVVLKILSVFGQELAPVDARYPGSHYTDAKPPTE